MPHTKDKMRAVRKYWVAWQCAKISMTGDGLRPTCRNCEKSRRTCAGQNDALKFVIHTTNRDSFKTPSDVHISAMGQTSASDTFTNSPVRANASPLLDQDEHQRLVSCTPREALTHIKISHLFRYYIDILAPWYDLCDEDQHFGRVVPMHALDEPLLFKAIIAFSAYHKGKVSGRIEELGITFHAACVQDMLAVMDDFPQTLRGNCLAATCLLRSYEILTGTLPLKL